MRHNQRSSKFGSMHEAAKETLYDLDDSSGPR
jgi:hypothetical protein